jgi:nucleotide-binding universal stress UspA family protein
MFDKVLVPLDGSELAEAVVPYVEDLAERCVAEVILLRVVPMPQDTATASIFQPSMSLPGSDYDEVPARHPIYRDQEIENLRTETVRSLNPIKERLSRVASKVRVEVAFGRPAKTIVDFAEREGVNLIALSSHGRGGFSRWVFGGVADRVLRGTTIPVLLIRPPGAGESSGPPGVGEKE